MRQRIHPVRLCTVDACERRHYGQGYCSLHYQRLYRNGTLELKVAPAHGTTTAYVHRKCRCDKCVAAHERAKQGWHSESPEYMRQKKHRAKLAVYGLTPDEYEEMLVGQAGRCAICKGVNPGGKSLGIDHNHTTGRVRGLLCNRCNAAIGMLCEDVTITLAAVDYLLVHGEIDNQEVVA